MTKRFRRRGQHFMVFLTCGLLGLLFVFAAGVLSSIRFQIAALSLIILAWILFVSAMGAVTFACSQEMAFALHRWRLNRCSIGSIAWVGVTLSLSVCATAFLVATPFLMWFSVLVQRS